MPVGNEPTDDQPILVRGSAPPRPRDVGLVLAVLGASPADRWFRVVKNRPLRVGRSPDCDIALDDAALSRAHVEVSHDGAAWTFRDLGSKHGTFVDGERLVGELTTMAPRTLRLGGNTILAPVPDIQPYVRCRLQVDGDLVIGSLLAEVYATVTQAAEAGLPVLVRGENGVGKEDASACYARACRRALVTRNASSLSSTLAQSELFGAKKGSHSAASADSEGWFGTADGKVLFLDEVGELPLDVQPMVLRAVEAGEVQQVGGPVRRVDVRLVTATNRNLEAGVREGRFREDLLRRLEKVTVTVPPLRDRLPDVPWMVAAMMQKLGRRQSREAPAVMVEVVEACMLAPWSGNAREMDSVVTRGVLAAWREGVEVLELRHCAGLVAARVDEKARRKAAFFAALERLGGNGRAAAREVGVAPSTAGDWVKERKGKG